MTSGEVADGWPFWAPLDDAEIADVLALSGLSPGERFADLGCGDGRVLAAALDLGATVTGYEVDPQLAERTRAVLAPAGARARVIEGSFYDADFDADVVFAYLSPTVLQRLSSQLQCLPAKTRVITAWFDIPGWGPPTRQKGSIRCYQASSVQPLPAISLAAGWSSPGLLCALPSAAKMLATTSLNHPRGPVTIDVDSALSDFVAIGTGADYVDGDVAVVTVDVVVGPCPTGSFVRGMLRTSVAGSCELFCFTPTSTPTGFWPIDSDGCARLRSQFAIGAAMYDKR